MFYSNFKTIEVWELMACCVFASGSLTDQYFPAWSQFPQLPKKILPQTKEIWNMVRCLCFCNPSFINLKWACLGKINQTHSVFATCVSAPLLIDQSWNAVLCLFEMFLNILCLENLQTREFSFLFVNFPGEDKVLYVSQT